MSKSNQHCADAYNHMGTRQCATDVVVVKIAFWHYAMLLSPQANFKAPNLAK
jgi:hypothetical protein